jgi:hypothetical protein
MKIKINTELNGTEVISEYILPQLKEKGITPVDGELTCEVWSEKAQKFIKFEASQIKFIFNR